MNETKHSIEISGAIIEQLSSLNEEEPTKYWDNGVLVVCPRADDEPIWDVFTTERAAWISREDALKDADYYSHSLPYEVTKEQAELEAKKNACTRIVVNDEAGDEIDWWTVE